MTKTIGSLMLVALAAGCTTTPLQKADPVATTTPQPVVAPAVEPVQATAPAGNALSELTDPKSPLSKRSVYFAYDRYAIESEYRTLVDAHAKYLSSHPVNKILIQGNADERGSREYNLALGQKRADAVRRGLQALGVPEKQIEAVSLGEERPRATERNEAAWAENRRADILYPGEF